MMGFFKSISDAMNEEFIIAERSVARFNADPASLDDILTEQHARGIGSPRGLREYSRALAAEDEGRLQEYRPSAQTARERLVLRRSVARKRNRGGPLMAGVSRVLVAAALGLAGAAAWNHLRTGHQERNEDTR